MSDERKSARSGEHPAVQEYRKKLESIAHGVGEDVKRLDENLSQYLSDLKSSHPPPHSEETFHFSIQLNGVTEVNDEIERRIFVDAGINDATLSSSEGIVTLSFSRSAKSIVHAKASALEDIERAGYSPLRISDD